MSWWYKQKRLKKKTPANLAAVETQRVEKVELPQEGMRCDVFLHQRNPWYSRTQMQTAFEEDRVSRNGVACPAGRKLKAGDVITLILPPPHEDVEEMQRIPFEVVFEDDVMLVVSKPPHLIVHPTGGYRYTTLLNALHFKYRNPNPDVTPRLVNRIDKETSGLVICGKTSKATGQLSHALEQREVVKEYIALVEGLVELDQQMIDLPIGKARNTEIEMLRGIDHEFGQPSQTEVWVIERFRRFTLVRCRLHTGRMHQIRVHMQAIGHPLVCDHHYGLRDELLASDLLEPAPAPRKIVSPYGYLDGDSDADVTERIRANDTSKRHEYESLCRGEIVKRGEVDRLWLGRCALHSHYLKIAHPVSGEAIELTAPLPRDIQGAVDALKTMK